MGNSETKKQLGHLWEYTGSKQSPFGEGFIYQLRAKPDYDDLNLDPFGRKAESVSNGKREEPAEDEGVDVLRGRFR